MQEVCSGQVAKPKEGDEGGGERACCVREDVWESERIFAEIWHCPEPTPPWQTGGMFKTCAWGGVGQRFPGPWDLEAGNIYDSKRGAESPGGDALNHAIRGKGNRNIACQLLAAELSCSGLCLL